MNVIIAYLDSMFSAYPQTPRLLEAKAELQGMMEDAYTSFIAEGHSENVAVGRVIRDFGNLEEVAPVLGITTDLTPDTAPASPRQAPAAAAPQHPPVTLDEARSYADAQERVRFRVAGAIALFVLAPAAVVSLPVAARNGLLPITDEAGVFIGILFLLVLAAVGVMLLISTSRETAPFTYLTESRFSPNPVVTSWAESLAEQHDRARIRALQIAIALWILAPLPLIAFALLLDDSPLGDFWVIIGVVLVLALVATGLAVLLPQTWAQTVAENLGRGTGRRGSVDDAIEDDRSIVSVIAAFYWPLLTAIFLAWSFIGNAWGSSWIIWPVGAVLFGAIAAGGSAVESYRRARQHPLS